MFGSMHTYTSMLDKSLEAEQISVSVVGTGPFGVALSNRLKIMKTVEILFCVDRTIKNEAT